MAHTTPSGELLLHIVNVFLQPGRAQVFIYMVSMACLHRDIGVPDIGVQLVCYDISIHIAINGKTNLMLLM